MLEEQLGENGVVVKQPEHDLFVNADEIGVFHGSCRSHVCQLPGKTPFPKKDARLQYGDNGFFALLRDYGQFDLACQDIEHRLRRLSLRKDNLLLRKRQIRFTDGDLPGLRQLEKTTQDDGGWKV